ncbi:MAG: hypothetical protein R3B72_38090 [Polyangiaceae bacterium]
MSGEPRKDEQALRAIARLLAERLASDEGARAMAEAAEASRKQREETLRAARLDPTLLHKRVTI